MRGGRVQCLLSTLSKASRSHEARPLGCREPCGPSHGRPLGGHRALLTPGRGSRPAPPLATATLVDENVSPHGKTGRRPERTRGAGSYRELRYTGGRHCPPAAPAGRTGGDVGASWLQEKGERELLRALAAGGGGGGASSSASCLPCGGGGDAGSPGAGGSGSPPLLRGGKTLPPSPSRSAGYGASTTWRRHAGGGRGRPASKAPRPLAGGCPPAGHMGDAPARARTHTATGHSAPQAGRADPKPPRCAKTASDPSRLCGQMKPRPGGPSRLGPPPCSAGQKPSPGLLAGAGTTMPTVRRGPRGFGREVRVPSAAAVPVPTEPPRPAAPRDGSGQRLRRPSDRGVPPTHLTFRRNRTREPGGR